MSDAHDDVEIDGARVLRKKFAASIGLAVLAAVMFFFAYALGMPGDRAPLAALFFAGGIASSFGALGAALLSDVSAAERGRLRASAEGLDLNGRRILDSSTIRRAFVVPESGGAIVRFVRAGVASDLGVRVHDVQEARRVLRAVGHDPSHVVTPFRVRSTSARAFRARWTAALVLGISLGAIAFVARQAPMIISPLFAVLAVATLAVLNLPRGKILVGADGVLLRSMFLRRFVPLRDIARVEVDVERIGLRVDAALVRISLHRGERIDIVARAWDSRYRSMGEAAISHAHVIAERIEEAIASRAAATETSSATSVLERASRPFSTWIRVLRTSANGRQTFRTEAISTETLWHIVEDAAQETTKRAAAAVALGPHLDDEGRARLRVAAEASAAPQLRVALEAAADDDTEKIAGALEAVERETRSSASSA